MVVSVPLQVASVYQAVPALLAISILYSVIVSPLASGAVHSMATPPATGSMLVTGAAGMPGSLAALISVTVE